MKQIAYKEEKIQFDDFVVAAVDHYVILSDNENIEFIYNLLANDESKTISK